MKKEEGNGNGKTSEVRRLEREVTRKQYSSRSNSIKRTAILGRLRGIIDSDFILNNVFERDGKFSVPLIIGKKHYLCTRYGRYDLK